MMDCLESKVKYDLETSEVCSFLAEYASWLLGCGATCIRIEKNVERIAEAFGMKADLMIMPAHIQISVCHSAHEDSCECIRKIHKTGISFDINTQLSKLSWDIADKKLNFQQALQTFQHITQTKPENQWRVLVLASLANLAFCRLFNGDWIAMLVVFMATLMGYRLKQVLLSYKVDVRVVFFCSAFLSSVIAAGACLFLWGNTPETALATSVLYLIPGIPYINSVSDMIDGHYVCAFSRFMDSAILTICLSMGLCGGLLLMRIELF